MQAEPLAPAPDPLRARPAPDETLPPDGRAAAPRPSETTSWSSMAVRLGWLVIGLGAVLRIRQYLADRSLWRDEAALVYNLLHRGYDGFTRPLAFQQGTPPGFYVVEKAVSQGLGTSELALRLFPLVCSLAALVVGLKLVRRHLSAPVGLIALVLCATSPALIYYSSEVKQYSTDVLIALLILLAASNTWRQAYSRRSCIILAVTGVVAIPFSHASTFTLAAVGLILAWPLLRSRRTRDLARLASVGAAWMVMWVAVYALFDRGLNDNSFLQAFWSDAFLPIPPTSHAGLDRWGWALTTLFSMLTGNAPLMAVFAPLTIVGIVRFARRQRGILAVLLLPWAVVVVASSVRLYPASDRLVLFLIPSLAVLVAGGTVSVYEALKSRGSVLATAGVAVVLILAGSVALHWFVWPSPIEELRPLLQVMRTDERPGDAAFVTEVAVPAYDYYAGRLDLSPTSTVLSTAQPDDRRALDHDLAPLLGHDRVWVVSSQFDQPGVPGEVTAELGRHGRLIQQWNRPGSTLYLYDLSSPSS